MKVDLVVRSSLSDVCSRAECGVAPADARAIVRQLSVWVGTKEDGSHNQVSALTAVSFMHAPQC